MAMAEPEKMKAEEPTSRHPWADSFALGGPWTEADEIWFECMTGDYDRRRLRETSAREAAESDL
jgi:hypothetical protein